MTTRTERAANVTIHVLGAFAMVTRTFALTLIAIAFAITCLPGSSHAGPLNPPAGAVAPSGKTISEASPGTPIIPPTTSNGNGAMYRITTSGYYYLTGNIDVIGAGIHGIEISADDVTLDLRGFRIQGTTATGDLIKTVGFRSGVEVRSGSLVTTGGMGINFVTLGRNGRIIDISVRDCVGVGIWSGVSSVITNCQASACQTGFVVDLASNITDSIARQNVVGFLISNNSRAERCNSAANTGVGFQAATGAIIQDCSASSNAGGGITLAVNASAIRCVVRQNTGSGITAERGCVVRENNVSGNTGDGLRINRTTHVIGNAVNANGTSGTGVAIRCTGNGNRVEGNVVNENPVGIKLEGSPNVFVRNTCAGNLTNYDVASGNIGRVIPPSASTAFIGNLGGTSFTTDPDVNLAY